MSVSRKLRREMDRQNCRIEPLRQQETPFGRKMSQIILEYAEPLLDCGDDYSDEDFKADVSLAIMCWNISFFSPRKQKKFINMMLDAACCGSDMNCRLDMAAVIHSMIDRRKTFYAHEKRFVQDYQVANEGQDERLIVLSGLIK